MGFPTFVLTSGIVAIDLRALKGSHRRGQTSKKDA